MLRHSHIFTDFLIEAKGGAEYKEGIKRIVLHALRIDETLEDRLDDRKNTVFCA
jgi:hypothetical protein